MTDLKATPEDVRYAYRLLLGREPDETGLQHYQAWVESGDRDPSALAQTILESAEYQAKHPRHAGIEVTKRSEMDRLPLHSQACSQEQLESPEFRHWAASMHETPGRLHRKLWEFCFIAQALHERSLLRGGCRGLGFAVGNEPLPALFASLGCSILATDLGADASDATSWINSNQHADSVAQLNARGLCDPDVFAANVRFGEVDMRIIPGNLRGFDFLWSSCALEHLGTLQLGMDFVWKAMACLQPGGVAVHTTEFNCDSNDATIETGSGVIYRRRDLEALVARLREAGHEVEPLDFYLGESDADRYVDEPPYQEMPHLKLRLGPFASTSFGLIVRKGGTPESVNT